MRIMEGVLLPYSNRETYPLITKLLKDTKAVAAIEFALALPVLAILFSGLINLGLIITKKIQLVGIVSVGMLYAYGNSSTPSSVQTAMQNSTTLSPVTVSATQFCRCLNGAMPSCGSLCIDGFTAAKYDTVTASTQVTLITPLFTVQDPYPISVQGTIRVP